MQPYFFPYLGYFQLMAAADCWIVFDTPQYIRHGWVNRNRILSPAKVGWKYIRIPLIKSSRITSIRDKRIATGNVDWKTDLVRSLAYYRQLRAPFFEETMDFVSAATRSNSSWLSEVLIETISATARHLKIELDSSVVFSQLSNRSVEVEHAGQWALRMCQAFQATTYINLPGGRELFQPREFNAVDVKLQFIEPSLTSYRQGDRSFLAGLSILDVLMWNGAERTAGLVNQYSIVD